MARLICPATYSILYGLTGLINIAIGLAMIYLNSRERDQGCNYGYNSGYSIGSRVRVNKSCCAGFWRGLGGFVLWLMTPAIWILDHPLAISRFGFRYICKALENRKSQRDKKVFHDGKKPDPGKQVFYRKKDQPRKSHPGPYRTRDSFPWSLSTSILWT